MNELQSTGLNPKTIAALQSVFSKYPEIEKAILYGSRALGTFNPGSDIDLTLIAPLMSLSQMMKIATETEELLLPYKIDLSLKHKIENESLTDHIDRVGLELYSKESKT
jgi:predicted nucleotidyltransferase